MRHRIPGCSLRWRSKGSTSHTRMASQRPTGQGLFARGSQSGTPCLLRRGRNLGVQHLGMEEVDFKDPITMQSVARDGKAMGEVMFRGNTVMNSYYNDIKATEEAFRGGWFRTGDWGVMYPDGYIEVKDRSIDIIVSGGENISSIEVEAVIFSHPAVFEAAVVGGPDEDLGETPCAFLKLKEGHAATDEEIMTYCRERLPHYKVPRTVVFEDLPKTSTGKTQKYALRARAKAIKDLV